MPPKKRSQANAKAKAKIRPTPRFKRWAFFFDSVAQEAAKSIKTLKLVVEESRDVVGLKLFLVSSSRVELEWREPRTFYSAPQDAHSGHGKEPQL